MRLGLIGRADGGGLGSMTQEFYRHLQPERVLGIDLGERGRGPSDWSRFPGAVVNEGMDDELLAETIHRFCDGLDVVYTAETWYRADFADIARSVGCRTVLHAMPELWRADLAPPDVVWAPTTWELGRLPADTLVVPVPVVLQERPPVEDLVLYHVGAPAMLDRNGSHLLLEALPVMRQAARLVMFGPTMPGTRTGRVVVEHRPEAHDYWQVHPPEASVLVLPRRYAGLSLPMQEAAARGMAVVSLDLEPQRQWIPRAALAPAFPWRTTRFPGGQFTVYAAEARQLAAVLDRVVSDDAVRAALVEASECHAADLSWDLWVPRYRELLEAACG